jgi:hypothetical protein
MLRLRKLSKSDDLKQQAQEMLDGEIEAELARLRASVMGECLICGDAVTEYDLTYGTYGGEWRGEECYHSVCLSGKLAVAY